MSPNHWSQLQTRFFTTFSPHFHYKTIGANCKLHLHHIFTTFTCHQTIGANNKTRFSLHFHSHFSLQKLLEPIVNFIYTTFSTTFTCHQTIGANYKLDFHYIFTTFSLQKLLEPIVNYIYTTFSLHFHHIYMSTKPLEANYKLDFHYRANVVLKIRSENLNFHYGRAENS